MPDYRLATLPLAEAAEKEEAANEAISDVGFVAAAPVGGSVAAYSAGATYAKGALVEELGIVYRSQAAGNKGNEPKADTDFAHWAPQPTETYPVQNSGSIVSYDEANKLRTRYQIVGSSTTNGPVYEWLAGGTYNLGEFVALKGIGYECRKTGTEEEPPGSPAWTAVGPAIQMGV